MDEVMHVRLRLLIRRWLVLSSTLCTDQNC